MQTILKSTSVAEKKLNTVYYVCSLMWPGSHHVCREHKAALAASLGGLPQPLISTSSYACHNYFHSRTWACKNCLHISGSQERYCMNFLWSVTCQISLGCLKHATLKFSPLPLCCLFTRDDEINSCVQHLTSLQKSESHISWPAFVIMNTYLKPWSRSSCGCCLSFCGLRERLICISKWCVCLLAKVFSHV